MTTPVPVETRDCVLIRLPDDVENARRVLAGAISLFGPATDVVLWTPDEPTEAMAAELGAMVQELAGGVPAIDIDLVGAEEAVARDARASVVATGDPMSDAEAIVLLASVAFRDWGIIGEDVNAAPGATAPSAAGADLRRQVQARVALRDAAVPPGTTPVVAVVAQVQSTFGAVQTICEALAADPRVRLELVAVESEHEPRATSTAAHLRSLGYEPRDAAWLQAQLDDPASGLGLVLFYDPWDDLRPEAARALTVANAGVRIAYVPYGNNVGAGDHMATAAYNLPVHQLAWRLFTRSDASRDLFGRLCTTGNRHVHVVGMPKFDRVVRLAEQAPLDVPQGRATVLWNPHFTFGPDGWSTFDRYLMPMLSYAAAHPELTLVVRPHFRLLRDLPLAGGEREQLLAALTRAATAMRNVVIDTSADYVAAFAAADAMVSDLSSLITEFVLTGKPLCYLHKLDGPGTNEDSEYFYETVVATSWPAVERFLDHVLASIDDIRAATDLHADARSLLKQRHFPHEDGRAGARVAAVLVDALTAERSLTDGATHDLVHH
jgi:hypothetical protein